MLPARMFSVNTFDKDSLQKARDCGLGLEIEEFLWPGGEAGGKLERVAALARGFSALSFHGTAVSRDIEQINRLPDDVLLAAYNESFGHSDFLGIDKIVFHSNYLADIQPADVWLREKAAFWRAFLVDKPPQLRVYVENLADDTPDLLAELHDMVGDCRFKICLDTGHACCNSPIPLPEWIRKLGCRIEHAHLHNNDGNADGHRSLGKGVLDMAAVIELLLAHANARSFVLECDFDESLAWLKQNNFLPEI